MPLIIESRPGGAGYWAAVLALAVAANPAPAQQMLADALAEESVAALATEAREAGDPGRGAVVFHTTQSTCTRCHGVDGRPSSIGPNLALPIPDPETGRPLEGDQLTEHLVASILDPSASIRPTSRGVTLVTNEGRTVSGLIARETPETIVVREPGAATETEIPVAAIDERAELAASLMPMGLANTLADRQQFLDLVRYLDEIVRGGPQRAAELAPDPQAVAAAAPAAERDIDHAGFIADWSKPKRSREALARGQKIYERVCASCHGTRELAGSLPTALRFAEGRFKFGADPYAMYRTLTHGAGLMLPQSWMVPSQKYDVIHYVREEFLKSLNPSQYVSVTPDYLAGLPPGASRGPAAASYEPWRMHDYGPFLAATIEVGRDGSNVARKGFAVRLDRGPGGVGRSRTWILHDLDTLRAAAIVSGDGFVDWEGINFDGRHGSHPHARGMLIAAIPSGAGWADPTTGSFTDPRPLGRDGQPYGPLPKSHARLRAVHHADDTVVLDAEVAGCRVLETTRLEAGDPATPLVTRIWHVSPHPQDLLVRVADDKASAAVVTPAPIGPRLDLRDGFHVLTLPPSGQPVVVGVAVAAGDVGLADRVRDLPPPVDLTTLLGRPARDRWPDTLHTTIAKGDDRAGFAVDTLTSPAANPWKAQLRFSGLDFLTPDVAVLCTWDGDVWTCGGLASATDALAWRRIASGLFQPLGIRVIHGAIHVGCRDRIVVLRDLDGDGCTDRYDTFNDDHQVTEHFHEFAMGLETDAAGNLYYAKSARHALPAVVPHHGTLLKVSADGSATEILATGFRAANGVCVEPDGTFFVTDQEGHWTPKNRINHVRPGGFYGNLYGYHDVTDPGDDAMEQPLAWITNEFDRSPAELVRVPADVWSPLSGGLLELSYGMGRIHLVLPESLPSAAPGQPMLQGGLVALPIDDLPTGVMRGRFHPTDRQLYACGLHAWAGNRTAPGGFFRVRRTAAMLRMPVALAAHETGLTITFSAPLARSPAADPASWGYTSWSLERSKNYGSEHVDERGHAITAVDLSSDGLTARLSIEGFAPTTCYELRWDLAAEDGSRAKGRIHGTVHATRP